MSGEKLLQGAGSVSHEKAIDKATTEYKKYQQKTLSEVEKSFLETLKAIENKNKQWIAEEFLFQLFPTWKQLKNTA